MDWYVKHSDENENALCHYGVKGMKWGVVNEDEKSNSKSVAYKNITQGGSKKTEGLGYNTSSVSNRSNPNSKITIKAPVAKQIVTEVANKNRDALSQVKDGKGKYYEGAHDFMGYPLGYDIYKLFNSDQRSDIVRELAKYLSSDDLRKLISRADSKYKKHIEYYDKIREDLGVERDPDIQPRPDGTLGYSKGYEYVDIIKEEIPQFFDDYR